MTAALTHYVTLEVIETASAETIRGAYKHLAQRWHPDKNPTCRDEALRKSSALNAAYRVLSNPELRRQYDDSLRMDRKQQETDAQQGARTESRRSTGSDQRAPDPREDAHGREDARKNAYARQKEQSEHQAKADAANQDQARAEAKAWYQARAKTDAANQARAKADAHQAELRENFVGAQARQARLPKAKKIGWLVALTPVAIAALFPFDYQHELAANMVVGGCIGLVLGLAIYAVVLDIDDINTALSRKRTLFKVAAVVYAVSGFVLWDREAQRTGAAGFDQSDMLFNGYVWGGVMVWGFLPALAALTAGAITFAFAARRVSWVVASLMAGLFVTGKLLGNIAAMENTTPAQTSAPLASQTSAQPSKASYEYQRRLGVYESTYPQLNPDHSMFDARVANSIAASMDRYIQQGHSDADALTRAVQERYGTGADSAQQAASLAAASASRQNNQTSNTQERHGSGADSAQQAASLAAASASRQNNQILNTYAERHVPSSAQTCPQGTTLMGNQCCTEGWVEHKENGGATLHQARCEPAH